MRLEHFSLFVAKTQNEARYSTTAQHSTQHVHFHQNLLFQLLIAGQPFTQSGLQVGHCSFYSLSHAHFIRTSGGKGTGRMGRWGSMRGSRPGTLSGGGVGGTLGTLRHYPTSTPALRSSISTGPRLSVDSSDTGSEAVQSFHKAALYVFGEKTQIKVCIYFEKLWLSFYVLIYIQCASLLFCPLMKGIYYTYFQVKS